jgi:hypothetical protein
VSPIRSGKAKTSVEFLFVGVRLAGLVTEASARQLPSSQFVRTLNDEGAGDEPFVVAEGVFSANGAASPLNSLDTAVSRRTLVPSMLPCVGAFLM